MSRGALDDATRMTHLSRLPSTWEGALSPDERALPHITIPGGTTLRGRPRPPAAPRAQDWRFASTREPHLD